MQQLQDLVPSAEIVGKASALRVNVSAAVGLSNVMKSNLGPTGTLKLLVGATIEQLKLTKDGLTLLKEMQIQHPTAALIARAATAQDDVTGDGTTGCVLLTAELLRQSLLRMEEQGGRGLLHPRSLTAGLDLARDAALEFLKDFTVTFENPIDNRDLLQSVARTSLQTKLDAKLVEPMASAVVDAIQTIYVDANKPLDLHRVEIMPQERRLAAESRFVRGLVLDHAARHPDMPNELSDCYVMTCNLSLEYEQAETSAGFVYSTAEQREALVESERKWLDDRCRKIVDFKRAVCTDENKKSFVIMNQKGVDPLSLDIFAKEGILCLRRVKRRNMERLVLATGGKVIQSLEDLTEARGTDDPASVLGMAGSVRQVVTGDDDRFTYVQDCPGSAASCTLLLQGPNKMTLQRLQDAVQDGLRAVKNCVEDGGAVVPGGGAFELAASQHLSDAIAPATKGKAVLGVQAYAAALLVIPKTLAANSGFDVSDCLLQMQRERRETGMAVGLDCGTGQAMLPSEQGVWDGLRVKRQQLHLSTVLANQLLLVDEVMRAGKQMGNQVAAAQAVGDPMAMG